MNPKDLDLQKIAIPAIVSLLVVGAIWLAIVDKETRPSFSRLVDLGLGGLLGWVAPNAAAKKD